MKFADVNLLKELEKEEFVALRGILGKRSYASGEIIYRPDTTENAVFLVASGRVRVFLAYEEKEFTVALLETGDIYTSHTGAFVEALEETSLLSTDARTFQQQAMSIPVVTQTMVRVLGRIMRNAFGLIDGLAFGDSTTRLATFLLDSMQDTPEKEHDAATPHAPLVRLGITGEQLANHVGATRQTVSTLLSDMVRSGILEKRGRGCYAVLDPARLRELARQ